MIVLTTELTEKLLLLHKHLDQILDAENRRFIEELMLTYKLASEAVMYVAQSYAETIEALYEETFEK